MHQMESSSLPTPRVYLRCNRRQSKRRPSSRPVGKCQILVNCQTFCHGSDPCRYIHQAETLACIPWQIPQCDWPWPEIPCRRTLCPVSALPCPVAGTVWHAGFCVRDNWRPPRRRQVEQHRGVPRAAPVPRRPAGSASTATVRHPSHDPPMANLCYLSRHADCTAAAFCRTVPGQSMHPNNTQCRAARNNHVADGHHAAGRDWTWHWCRRDWVRFWCHWSVCPAGGLDWSRIPANLAPVHRRRVFVWFLQVFHLGRIARGVVLENYCLDRLGNCLLGQRAACLKNIFA